MKFISISLIISSALLLAACAQKQSNQTYSRADIGVSRAVDFGTISSMRVVDIQGTQSGTGLLLGGLAGGGAASTIGDGSGQTWATVGGAIAGAVIGSMVEEEMSKGNGTEYVVDMRDGSVKTIVQENISGNPELHVGDKVMLQYCDSNEYQKRCAPGGDYQRLIPVDNFPPEPAKKKKHHKKK